MTGAGAVAGLVLLEWSVGWAAAAAWTQSWSVVRRGHFRIIAWCLIVMCALVVLVFRSIEATGGATLAAVLGLGGAVVLYLLVQYSRTDLPGVVVGGVAAGVGVAALAFTAADIDGWPLVLSVVQLLTGAALLGAVTNGMLLGHWYLNQPGLKPWALARLTTLALVATAASAVVGLASAGLLATASSEGAVLGLPGFGESFGGVFYAVWLVTVAFTGAVVWMARRCVRIRSIQSATGLYYVALLTAGVAEFLVRYLMVNAS